MVNSKTRACNILGSIIVVNGIIGTLKGVESKLLYISLCSNIVCYCIVGGLVGFSPFQLVHEVGGISHAIIVGSM